MEFEKFEEILWLKAKSIEIELNSEQIEKFYNYYLLLIEWNEKMNLTAITEANDVILKHFIDSLTICKYIPENARIIDIGTGAGFPGIPLKIYREDIEMVLLDSLNKRITFLDEVINKLNLKKIQAIHGRAEELARNIKYRESFDVVTSRAVANMSTLSEYMIPFVRVNGVCVMMKGSEYKEEFEKAKKAISLLGGNLEKVEEFLLPETDIKRSVILIGKIKNTPKHYPRKAGMPSKNPIV